MQDIHWMDGAVGYFPSYTLGAMLAAQLFERVDADLGGVDERVSRGEFGPIIEWLRDNIHALGSRYSTGELVEKATGRSLDASAFLGHLERRYLRDER
jgi:carboxypeptidase Taq